MGPAVAERHAETLRITDRDIGAPFPGWRKHCEREKVCSNRYHSATGMRPIAHGAPIVHRPVGRRILQQAADHGGISGRGRPEDEV